MACGKLLVLLVSFCFLVEGKLLYEHDEDTCAKPYSEKNHPFCNWYYLVYAPRIFRAGDEEKVLISTHNVNFEVSVTTKFWSGKKLLASSDDIIKPGVLKEVAIKVPLDAGSSGYLEVEGSAEVPKGTNGITEDATWTFKNKTSSIEIKRSSTQVFIQTDRPIYKPGETIRFRVLSIDDNLKAVKGVVSKVSILNPSQTLMRQWRNVKLSSGFASFKLKLSIKPVLGLWRIKATVNGKQKIVFVKVDKYVLPKFQVLINPPSYIAYGQRKVDGEFCARYSYGKDVSGLLKAKICADYPARWDWRSRKYSNEKKICENIVKKISGCHPFEIDLLFFQVHKYDGWRSPRFTLEASVKEGATAITLNATKVEMTVNDKYVELSFDGTPAIFKPGLPFEAWVNAKRPDGQPVDNIKVEISIRDSNWKRLFDEKVTIKRGKAKINLPKVPFNAKELRFDASYTREKIPGSVLKEWKRKSSKYFTANAWYSPSHSYLSITNDKKVHRPGTTAKFNVKYTTTDDDKVTRKVFYALMSKGNVVLSGSLSAEFAEAKERSRRSVSEDGEESPEKQSTGSIEEDDSDEFTESDIPGPEMTKTDAPEQEMTTQEVPKPKMATTEAPKKEKVSTQEMTTAPEITTPEMTTAPEMTTTAEPETTVPPYIEDIIFPYFTGKPVTRPPLPKRFSVGSFDMEIPITQEMTPSVRMLVYYIRDRETVADSIVIQTGNSFANKVSMKFSEKQVFPGTKVNLTLKASPGSNFAIGAVDKSVHFLRDANDVKAGEVLGLIKQLDVGPGYISNYDRCKGSYYYYSQSSFVDSQKAFNDNGMMFLSNLFIDTRPCYYQTWARRYEYFGVGATYSPQVLATGAPLPEVVEEVVPVTEERPRPVNKEKPKPKPKQKPKVRSEFPETWLWTEEKFDDKTGEKVVEVTVPDTITTWYASGFAVSDNTGLGVSNPAEIRGFKEVFVSMNLPYSVIRGEIVTLPIVIFNYMPDCLHAKISMKDTKDFRSLTRSYADFCICGGQSATVMFKIIPKKLGRIEIEAQAETLSTNTCPKYLKFDSNSYIDIVRRKLLVEPEGVEKEYTYNSLVCPKENSTVAEKVKLSIPDKVVPGSVYAELRVIGDLMGPSLSNIDSLLKMPYGCGEQNMLNFAPNIFIMQYLKATGQLTEEIRTKAEGYTLQGYQRELSYKHPDGSYSAFGERDKEGSMWLTAFVLKSFAQARPFIDIDKKVLNEAKRWITSKQNRDGCFPTIGTLHHKAMKGGVSSPVTLTGYVVISLLEADMKPESYNIKLAIDKCIKPNMKNVTDSYSIAILSYAMAKAGRQAEYEMLVKELNSQASRESGMRHWEEAKPKEEKNKDWFYAPYYQARSADIEMTSYALMALMPDNDRSKVLDSVDIVRWLSKQRNSLGGWSSTQDTVLAMQALAQYAALVYKGETDLKIDVSTEGLQHQFSVSSSNNLILQRIQLPSKFPTVLKTFAAGKGCALLSASVKYNTQQIQEVPAFSLSVDISPVKSKSALKHGRCRSQKMKICAKWLKKGDSNMAIIAVKMLSGFEPVVPTLDKAVKKDNLLKEYEKKDGEWIFYYSKIDDVCLSFVIKQANIVEGIKPSSVMVYDYYDKDMSATKKYKVPSKNCK